MGTHQSARSISLNVAQASVITQNRLVKLDSNGNAVPITGSGDFPVGVALEGSTDQQSAAISVALLDGAILTIEAGAAIARGATISPSANGRAATSSGTNRVVGISLDAAGAAGDMIRMISGSVSRHT